MAQLKLRLDLLCFVLFVSSEWIIQDWLLLFLMQKEIALPVQLDVNKEAIQTLVKAVGCTEAARQTGIPLNTILSWSARGKWLDLASVKPTLPPTVQPRAISAIIAPVALQNSLEGRKHTTKLNLSKYVVDASARAVKSNGDLHKAGQIRHVAAIAQVVWPEEQAPVVNIALLNGELGMG